MRGIGTLYAGLILLLALTTTAVYTFYVGRSSVHALREQEMLYEEARFLAEHANVTGNAVALPGAADVIVVDPEGVPHVARGVKALRLPWSSGASRIYVAVRGRLRVGAADPAAAAAVAAAAVEPQQPQATAPAANASSGGCLDPETLSRLAATGLEAGVAVLAANPRSTLNPGVTWFVGRIDGNGYFVYSMKLVEPYEKNGTTICGKYVTNDPYTREHSVECGSCISVQQPPGVREACFDRQQLTLTLANNIVVRLTYNGTGDSLRHDIYVEAPFGSLTHTRLELVKSNGPGAGLYPPVRIDPSGVARSSCGTGPQVVYLDVRRAAVLQLNTTLLPVQPPTSSGGGGVTR